MTGPWKVTEGSGRFKKHLKWSTTALTGAYGQLAREKWASLNEVCKERTRMTRTALTCTVCKIWGGVEKKKNVCPLRPVARGMNMERELSLSPVH